MKISFRGDYALKAILDLSVHYNKGLVRIQEIAKRQDIPIKYLEQLLLALKGAGYLNSQRGAKGGYYLAKNPKNILLGEIIRLMEGPISPITCVSKSCFKRCNEETKCVFRPLWNKIRLLTEEVVDQISFADMCRDYEEKNKEKSDMYYI
ncbi:MAG: Rrf2 family transcriptional regulator [Elusimicrobia bacterium]|nr:Rrf2 family transcriptional regulator [Elusimicrobiota bacterium]